jgi:hypothetical protein
MPQYQSPPQQWQQQTDYTQPQSYKQQPTRPPQPPRQNGRPWWISLIILAIIFVPYFWSRSGFHLPSTSTDTPIQSSQSVQQDQPTALPGWNITQTFTGTGPQKTEIFTVPNDWKIVWACYGIVGGYDGALSVDVMGADNSYVDSSAVNANCKGGTTTSNATEEHQGGKVYLAIQAAGDWTVEVQEPK